MRLVTLLALLARVYASPLFKDQVPDDGHSKKHGHGNHGLPRESPEFWWKIGMSSMLVLLGGLFAGLTLGLMGLDELHLRVLSASVDDTREKQNAVKVLRLLNKGRHWVLVVLLLGNVVVNESLPIFLDDALGGGVPAIIISSLMIVIFGIIPQAVSVRHGLAIGARCVPIVLTMMYVFAPVAWPIAKLLDYVLGKNETHTYKKAELKSFLQFHKQGQEPLSTDEISILNGVLELGNKNVASLMTPMEDVVTISADAVLDYDAVNRLLRSGYSRIPVHAPGRPLAFLGLLLLKKLSVYDTSEALPVSSFPLTILPEADPSINCFQALDYFQTGRAHLLLLSTKPGHEGHAIGIVTLEDVIEEIIAEEIVDETDRYVDNHSKKRVRRTRDAKCMRGIVENRNFRSGSVTDSERTPLLRGTGTLPWTATSSSLSESIANYSFANVGHTTPKTSAHPQQLESILDVPTPIPESPPEPANDAPVVVNGEAHVNGDANNDAQAGPSHATS